MIFLYPRSTKVQKYKKGHQDEISKGGSFLKGPQEFMRDKQHQGQTYRVFIKTSLQPQKPINKTFFRHKFIFFVINDLRSVSVLSRSEVFPFHSVACRECPLPPWLGLSSTSITSPTSPASSTRTYFSTCPTTIVDISISNLLTCRRAYPLLCVLQK